jgi:hypothetical protein
LITMPARLLARQPGPLATLLLLAGLLLPWAAPPVRAQSDLRSTFPGRRVGGGTRGECNSRLIVHLVPDSNVYAPGAAPLLGLLEGPAANPRPLELRFRPQSGGAAGGERLLVAGGAALVLLPGPALAGPTLWESSYRCDEEIGSGASDDPLQFVASTSPPALSLLVLDSTPADAALISQLQQLRSRCGGTVSRAEFEAAFGLTDLLDSSWPDQLPVRCPS